MSSTDPLPQTLCPRLFAPCIFSKLGVENRAQAIVLARDSGFGVPTAQGQASRPNTRIRSQFTPDLACFPS